MHARRQFNHDDGDDDDCFLKGGEERGEEEHASEALERIWGDGEIGNEGMGRREMRKKEMRNAQWNEECERE